MGLEFSNWKLFSEKITLESLILETPHVGLQPELETMLLFKTTH